MKTETTVHTVNTPIATMPASGLMPIPEKKHENKENNPSINASLNLDSTAAPAVPYSGPIDVQWNALKPIPREEAAAAEFITSVKSGLKLLNDMESSLAAMVLTFMTLCLKVFANLQKANMDMALNELNFIKMDMIRQIQEMKEEKESTFKKDMAMGIIEAVSSAVQLAGSAFTTAKLKGKLTEQETLFAQKDTAALKVGNENKMANASAKTGPAEALVNDDSLTTKPKLKADADETFTDVKDTLEVTKASQRNVNAAIDPTLTHEKIKIQSDRIRSEVDYINARQQVFSGLTALIKAASPFVQGSLAAEATTHQINAKEAENSKEIRNSMYRQYIDWAGNYRDSVGRMIATFEEMQKQDAENSNAASRKMV